MRLFLLALLCVASAWAAPVDAATVRRSLIKWEGYYVVPYKDGRVNMSVGIGHNLTAHGEPVRPRYTAAQINAMFDRDLMVALRACRTGVERFDELPEEVQLVCISLVWTCGAKGFMRFKDVRSALSRRAYTASSTMLYLSNWFRTQPAARANWAVNTLRSY